MDSNGRSEEPDGELGPSGKRNLNNNHSERGTDYAPSTPTARYNANIDAIRLSQELTGTGQQATPEQKEVLRRYSGFGGLGSFLNNEQTSKELRDLVGDDAFDEIALSANDAYYTPAYVSDTMWDIASALGFKGGNILEGSAGIGNIIGLMPQGISERSEIQAIEKDTTTGRILALLYPDAKVDIQGFEETSIPNNSVDLAITNVPFVTGLHAKDTTGDRDLSRRFRNIHDFCIAKNVRKLRQGGIAILITSKGTLDNSKKLRDWVVGEGASDFIGAFRMNNETFGGTPVTSDIIVIRKRVGGEKSPNAINVSDAVGTRTVEYDTGETKRKKNKKTGEMEEIPVVKPLSMIYNSYFAEHPENVAGVMKFGFEENDTRRPESTGAYPNGKNQKEMLADWVKSFRNIKSEKPAPTDVEVAKSLNERLGSDVREGSLIVNKNGEICVARLGSAVPIGVNANKVKGHTKGECLGDYNGIRKALGDVLEYQANNSDDAGLKPLLTALNKAYDSFVSKYGNVNRNTAISFLRNDVDFASIMALENIHETGDKSGRRIVTVNKSDVFKGRVISPKDEVEITNVADGIKVSLFDKGYIDPQYIADKIGSDVNDVRNEILDEELGYEDPVNGSILVSYDYLSGNVREKLYQAEQNNTDGRYDKNIKALRDKIKRGLGKLNFGIDPETMLAALELTAMEIEDGAVKFADYCKRLIETIGDEIRPYLKSFYESVRRMPEADKFAEDMDSTDFVDKFDVANFDKKTIDPIRTAQEMVAEKKVRENVAKIEKKEISSINAIRPIGVGPFGEIYNQFRGKPNDAIAFLISRKGGEALGALSHPEVGEIDLVWGDEGTGHSDGFGLAKLVMHHPEVVDNLQEILNDMHVTKRTENRVQLESDKYQAAVRLTWDDKRKTWLLTAFAKKSSVSDNRTDTDETINGKQNDTTTLQNTAFTSDGKGSENIDNTKEKAVKNVNDLVSVKEEPSGEAEGTGAERFNNRQKRKEKSDNEQTAKSGLARVGRDEAVPDKAPKAAPVQARIEDVGEKIGGAKKDLVRAVADKININGTTFAKIFPKFDYRKLVADGIDPKLVAGLKFVAEHAKEGYRRNKKRYKRYSDGEERALNSVRFMASYAKGFLVGETSTEHASNGFVFTEYGKRFFDFNVELFGRLYDEMGEDMLGVDLSNASVDIILTKEETRKDGNHSTSTYFRNGKEIPARYSVSVGGTSTALFSAEEKEDAVKDFIEKVKKAVDYDKANPFKLAVYYKTNKKDGYYIATKIGVEVVALTQEGMEYNYQYIGEHRAELQAMAERKAAEAKEKRKEQRKTAVVLGKFIHERRNGELVSGYKYYTVLGKEEITLMEFLAADERDHSSYSRAKDYFNEHEAELQERAQQLLDEYTEKEAERKGWKPQMNIGSLRPRIGVEYRKGGDVSAQELADTFGLRGVEFGNYVSQKERQQFMNECYDALMDMADILGVTPRALSLNGKLGLAIGARGGSEAKAHYEPAKNVINLTKNNGWGALAHEWWHAMDYYFGEREKDVPATRRSNDATRQEVMDAIRNLIGVINDSDYFNRSKNLDTYLNKRYYQTDTELCARAFQDYIVQRLIERGQVNDFLSHFTDAPNWNGEAETYPYPTGDEAAKIRNAFDDLFGAIEVKRESDNDVMFHISESEPYTGNKTEAVQMATDAVMQMLEDAGLDMELRSQEEGLEMADKASVALSRGKKRALETVSVISDETHHPAVVSSADGAKVLKNLETLRNDFEKLSNQPKYFIGNVAKSLGAKSDGSSSEYATFETKNGRIVTIRLANHNATVSNFDNRDENDGISIVITAKGNEGITNDGKAHVIEFYYDSIKVGSINSFLAILRFVPSRLLCGRKELCGHND